MKKNSFYFLAAVMCTALIVGCANLKSMEKAAQEMALKANPNPLEVHGDTVALTISGTFPPKYFPKKASMEAVPVFVHNGKETRYKTTYYQGEQAVGNGSVVPFKIGKSFTYTDRVAYTPEMANGKLELRIHGRMGKKETDFPALAIADGVITTPYLVKNDDKCVWSKDQYVRTLSYTNDSTQINFDYNSSALKPSELKDVDMANLGNWMKSVASNPALVIKKIEFTSYASPEGEMLLNDNLATERAEAGKKAFMDLAKKMKLTNAPESLFTLTPKGEDWEGFRAAMDASNIEDRNIIINVLKMTTDLQKREQEIKNISKTYTEIQKVIFPDLRRCRLMINYDLQGYSDEELVQIGSTNPSSLKYEELMRAGALIDDLNKKAAIYQAACALANADYRSFNNLGCVYYMQNKVSDAQTSWNKAYGMKKCAETANNMGIVTRVNGDRKGAMKYYSEAGAGSETNYNKGIIDIQNGNYSGAVSNMSAFKTFNSALAKLLNKDASAAKGDIDASGDSSAKADYLRAIICARNSDSAGVGTNLRNAVQKDASLGEKAKSDLEFRNHKDQTNF
jgi:outer membrane protein OmpA-like peptidoglycan-associated protein